MPGNSVPALASGAGDPAIWDVILMDTPRNGTTKLRRKAGPPGPSGNRPVGRLSAHATGLTPYLE